MLKLSPAAALAGQTLGMTSAETSDAALTRPADIGLAIARIEMDVPRRMATVAFISLMWSSKPHTRTILELTHRRCGLPS
jgi:hypothetical protein